MITPHYTWTVLDSTKISTYLTCPRKFFYEYILGWRKEGVKIHLDFGEALHAALELIEREKASSTSGGLDLLLAKSYQLFYTIFRSKITQEEELMLGTAKTCDNALKALSAYLYQTAGDDETCIETEIAGKVFINDSDCISYRVDMLGTRNTNNLKFIRDHKTASYMGQTWANAWDTNFQMGTYTHVLHSIFPTEEIDCVEINGIGMTKTKIDLLKVPVRKSMDMMEDWLWHANDVVLGIHLDTSALEEDQSKDSILRTFPKNPTACTNYGGCPYLPYCSEWANPLNRCKEVEHESETPQAAQSSAGQNIPTQEAGTATQASTPQEPSTSLANNGASLSKNITLEPPIGFTTSYWDPANHSERKPRKLLDVSADLKVIKEITDV